jgi:hypothetical protein
MNQQYFSLNEEARKIKSKLLILSGVALFVGLTEALPKKLTLIGLDLSNNQKVLGWFIFFIALILLFNYVVVSVLGLTEHYLPSLIKKETDKSTGDTLGLTSEECMQSQEEQELHDDNGNIGAPEQELKDINIKNEIIIYNYKESYIKLHDIVIIIVELIIPFVFSIVGMSYLYQYISCLK